jgi:Ca-activated chloride channel family protein
MITVLPPAPIEADPLAAPTLTTTDGAHVLPLVGLDHHLVVTGLTYELVATQRFANSLTTPLEAVYVFPLPPAGAVVEMVARFAGREVRAVLDRREAARATYAQAVASGHQAALLEEDRPSTFTMTVGNIPAGASVDVEIVVVGHLDLVPGTAGASATSVSPALSARLRLPGVVAPRYTSGTPLSGPSAGEGVTPDTDTVPDASRVTPPVAPDPTLAPRLTWTATFDDGGVGITSVRCTTHAVASDHVDGRIELRHDDQVADRDVAFELQLALDAPVAGARWTRDLQPDGRLPGTASALVTVVAPASLLPVRGGHDVVVLVDRSGSMDGWKMGAAADATMRLLDRLADDDRVAVATFDTSLDPLTSGLVPLVANRDAIHRALSLVTPRGGTEMAPALAWAVRMLDPSDGRAGTRRRTIVVVTDAQVSGEDEALRALGGDDGRALPRLILLGVDASANLGLLHRLAARSGGASEIVDAPSGIAAAVDLLSTYLGDPVVEDLRITVDAADGGDGAIGDTVTIAPAVLPPVFPGVPLRVSLRGANVGPVTITGRLADGTVWTQRLAPQLVGGSGVRWAFGRARVRDLEDAWAAGDDVSLDEIVDVALACGVLCRHTAFVAVDSRGPAVEGEARTLVQPVALPAGWAAAPGLQRMAADAAAPPHITMTAAPMPAVPMPAVPMPAPQTKAATTRRMPPQKKASPAVAAPRRPLPAGLDRVLAEIERALADPTFVPDAATRTRWARTVRAESRSAGLLGRRAALSAALRGLAQAITRWDPATRETVVTELARVRGELAAR